MSWLLPKILRARLKQAGIGVPTLAKRSKIPRQTISNWLAGQKPKNIEHVKAVADYFSMTVDELCFGVEAGLPGARARARSATKLEEHLDDIRAGVFEVVLRRVDR